MATLALGFTTFSAFCGEVAICDTDVPFPARMEQSFYGADGTYREILLSDNTIESSGCQSLELSVSIDRIVKVVPMPRSNPGGNPRRISLQGEFSNSAISVSEIIVDGATSETSIYLPLNTNTRGLFTERVFGVEERAELDDGKLLCLPGLAPAGLVLEVLRAWPRSHAYNLEIEVEGVGDFQIGISDRISAEKGAINVLGHISLGSSNDRIRRFNFLVNESGVEHWETLTVVCPQVAAELNVISMTASLRAAPLLQGRSAWIWSPAAWQEHSEALWNLRESNYIDTLFLTFPTSGSQVLSPELLAEFIGSSKKKGIDIWAVIGDARDVLPENLPRLLERIDAYKNYNMSVPKEQRLVGVQLDIEPYLLPGFSLNQVYWRDRYLATVSAANKQIAQTMSLELVVPNWWGSHSAWGNTFLMALPKVGVSIAVMNYRTTLPSLKAGASPFLYWGLFNNVPIRLAFESGRLMDEQRRNYQPSEDGRGELLLTQIGDQSLLLLFNETSEGLPGTFYRFTGESTFQSSSLTFSGDLLRLNTVIELLASDWSTWPSFAGVAIHGLEEQYLSIE